MKSWISLHRKIQDWEWYTDANTFRLFVHLLLKANHKDNKWRGIEIKRGQHITSLQNLSAELCLTIQQVRTSLNKLKSTREITSKTTNKFTLITITCYDSYQGSNKQTNIEITNEQQTNNKRITTNNNDNNENKNIYIYSQDKFSPPSREQVAEYFMFMNCEGAKNEAAMFSDYYDRQGWKLSNGNDMVKWTAAVKLWIQNKKKSDFKKNDQDKTKSKTIKEQLTNTDWADY